MRLTDARTLQIKEFTTAPPPYAILSHRWGRDDEEVTLDEFYRAEVTSRPGYRKIVNCCSQAMSDGLQYVWVNTCCIDKRSSAELSEAINSMFKWYRESVVCYAYLEDVDTTARPYTKRSRFVRSKWFTRGWTLQELIAPSVVIFFTSTWSIIGGRDKLSAAISLATHISPDFFVHGDLDKFSVAQKMSWASRRQTKRVEDEAYCLLGIFGVNIPLLYGEGRQAFRRLQEEIMRSSDDETLFAWTPELPQNLLELMASDADWPQLDCGLLSPSPKHFKTSGRIVQARGVSAGSLSVPHTWTNKGLQISLPVMNFDGSLNSSSKERGTAAASLSTSRYPRQSDNRDEEILKNAPRHPVRLYLI